MVIEDLGLAINKMDELKDKERNSRNAEAQKQLREKVIGLEAKTHLIIELLIYLKERLGYNPSAGMVHNLLSINTALREAIQNAKITNKMDSNGFVDNNKFLGTRFRESKLD